MTQGFRFPGPTSRTTIAGSTGSGKSQFGLWLAGTSLSTDRPIVIIDFKRDDLIGELPAQEIAVGEKPPRMPGLYVYRPLPDIHDEYVERFLYQCWAQEDIVLFVDESYMINRNSKAMKMLLTQGRSKHIQLFMLTQRPAFCNPWLFSESDFLSVFRLNKPGDTATLQDAISVNISKRLPEYHSYWYDVGRDRGFTLGPAPSRDDIIASFQRFAKRTVKVL